MSTVKINTTSERFSRLARIGEEVFHIRDLANLWEIRDKNNLHTTLKRYAQKGLLFRIYRGFYAIKPLEQIEPWILGIKAVHCFAYIGTETILFRDGIINQKLNFITMLSSKSKNFTLGNNFYSSRQLDDKYLYNPAGIIKENNIQISTAPRAIADLLYFNPQYYFDNNSLINWPEVKKIQKLLGYPATPKRYASS